MKWFENFSSNKDILEAYRAQDDALDGAIIHIAWYGYGDYCGSSLVVFEKDGKLFEVNGGHCSCNGLEYQWEPEETSWKALDMRDLYDSCEGSRKAQEALQRLVKENLSLSSSG